MSFDKCDIISQNAQKIQTNFQALVSHAFDKVDHSHLG